MRALHQENKITPDTFKENRLDFSITEFLDIDLAWLAAITFANFFGKFLRAGTGKDFS